MKKMKKGQKTNKNSNNKKIMFLFKFRKECKS